MMKLSMWTALLLLATSGQSIAQSENGNEMNQKSEKVQTALDRQKTLWRPEHSPDAKAWLDRYRAETEGKPVDPARFVSQPSGLSHRDIHSIINDRSLGDRFFEVHCDMLDPEKSVYVDPIFGDLHGQRAIRAWLVPIMSSSTSEASFDPIFPAEFLDDGNGGTSVDEWQLVQPVNGKWTKIVRGVSVRRYRDGWVRDAVDFFDTMPIRLGLAQAAELGERTLKLPEWPKVKTERWIPANDVELSHAALEWRKNRNKNGAIEATGLSSRDLHDLAFSQDNSDNLYSEFSSLLHPTASVYIDPIFGELHGRKAISEWLADVMQKAGNIEFELTQEPVFDNNMSYSEWRQVAILPDGQRVEMTRGSSIRRYQGGWIVYAADYFDTAPFLDPAIQAASVEAGSTVTIDDILKYRSEPISSQQDDAPVTDILGLVAPINVQIAPDGSSANVADQNVRSKLIEAATSEIQRTGNASISMREVSRLAGVSHNAPYSYFADKKSLLMAVATQSLWSLHDDMVQSARLAKDEADRHRLLGVAFVRFAIQNPGLFRLIGNKEITGAIATRELSQARIAGAQLFGSAVMELIATRSDAVLDPKISAVTGWALMQGLSTLLIEGQLIPGLLGLADGEEVASAVAHFFTKLLSDSAIS